MTAPADLDRQLADLVLEDRVLPLVAHLAALAIVVLLVRGALPSDLMLLWGGAIVVVVAGRALIWGTLARRAVPPRTVSRAVHVTLAVQGLAWGVGSAIAIPYLPAASIAFLLLAMAGLLSGSIATLIANRRVLAWYAIAMFVPPLLSLALTADDRVELIAILLIFVFAVFTVRLHGRTHQLLRARLEVEAELRRRERVLASAQAIAHVGSWEWDIETNIVTWSDEMRRIFGLPLDAPASFAGFLERVHPDDRARIQAVVAASVGERRATEYDWRTIRPDGEERLIHTRNMLLTDASGRPVRMLGTALDITERTRAEENQRTLLQQLQASIAEVKVLTGILPICSSCKRIRGDDGAWEAVESYVRDHTNAEFSHGLCPECAVRDWSSPLAPDRR